MIDLHTAPTPNGWKVSIMLEECALPYRALPVNLGKGEQLSESFLAISPNGRIPAIVDHDPVDGGAALAVFETAAILIYLAEKTGQFLPAELRARKEVLEWLVWQAAGLGPMLGQHGHFKLYAPERIAYATGRYRREALRLYGVLENRLAADCFVGGSEYSIADMACFPWIQTWKAQEIPIDEYPHLRRWYDMLKTRPALRRGMALGRDTLNSGALQDPAAREVLFGIKED